MRYLRLLFVVLGSLGLILMLAINSGGGEADLNLNPEAVACITGSVTDDVIRLKMEATAYTAGYESTGKRPGHPAYGITKSGTTVEEGRTIAVDPTIIPLGAAVEVWYDGKKLGDYVAEDIGGAIKGCIIDIYIEDLDRALQWGRRQVEVRVARGYLAQ